MSSGDIHKEEPGTSSQPIVIEEQFRMMADSAAVLIWISGTDKLCYYFNAGWLGFTGRTLEEEYGNGWVENVHPDDVERCLETYLHSFEQRMAFKMEYRLKRHDGQYRWLLDNGVPRYTAAGEFAGYIGSCIDIEDMKRAEQYMQRMNEELEAIVAQRTAELAQANKELERSNKELEQFAYAASHDLKEPIRKIIIYSDFILQNSEKTGHYAMKVQEAAFRMNALMDDLLALSGTGGSNETFTEVDLNKILENVKLDLELMLAQKQGTISAPLLPVIIGIPQQIQQLFYNLINNSLKYSKKDEPPHITITIEEVSGNGSMNNDYLKLNFADNGIGFSPEYEEVVFNAFQRLHSRDAYPGSGIGLALCKKVVQNHSGVIRAKSIPDQGTVFTVLLPKK